MGVLSMGIFCKPIVGTCPLSARLFLEAIGMLAIPLRFVEFRRLFDYCRRAGALIEDSNVGVQVHPHVAMEIALRDPYWLAYVPRWRSYEPEIEWVLCAFANEQVCFVDAGANHGYWSIFAAKFPRWTVQAVVAWSNTFLKPPANIAMNEATVTALHRAVSSESGREVRFATSDTFHAGAHVVASEDARNQNLEMVRTTSIDDLLQGTAMDIAILKLDVEGQELAALRGAANTLGPETLVLYEEHGSQHECEATRFLLEGGFSVCFLGRNIARPVSSIPAAL